MSEPIIEAEGVAKHFGTVDALRGLDLTAESGQVTAVLGPNGAGKSTFVRAVSTLLAPDAGSLRVAGIDVLRQPHLVRRAIGLAGQFAAVEPSMTGRENLRMIGRLFGLNRREAHRAASQTLERLGLTEFADRASKTYSGGLRRRLDLGASLVGAPRLLLLDEPTTGLDPTSRIQLWDTIRDLVAQGTDVLLTTQYLDEADQLAGHIAIIDNGRAVAAGSPSELKALAGPDILEVRARHTNDLPAIAGVLARFVSDDVHVDEPTRRITGAVRNSVAALTAAAQAFAELALEIEDLALRRPTLDEVFLTLTGAPAEPAADNEPATATP
ncbi:daunorubicin resistance protein DrrA family ABC transporter ATP-binding protein [Kribbella sancticallisti]|uniref:Daunorubicin resistance protein DrrA family ABC transporter ATP-binding protein n=1 Tax=Kribbella sancticallisti TaxID=460087 RepID=A0ABP4PE32_9ACTN